MDRLRTLHQNGKQENPEGEIDRSPWENSTDKTPDQDHHQHVPEVGSDEVIVDEQGDHHLYEKKQGGRIQTDDAGEHCVEFCFIRHGSTLRKLRFPAS